MKKWVWWISLTVLAVVVSLIEWRSAIPTGTLDVQIAGVFLAVLCLSLNVMWSYVSLVIVAIVMVLMNVQNGWTVLPILLSLIIISVMLRWRTSLDVHMTHSQAINFGLIVGGSQFIGMLLIVAVQTMMMTTKWDEFLAVLEMALPGSLLNGLLDCLLVPPLTLLVRHYTEKRSNNYYITKK